MNLIICPKCDEPGLPKLEKGRYLRIWHYSSSRYKDRKRRGKGMTSHYIGRIDKESIQWDLKHSNLTLLGANPAGLANMFGVMPDPAYNLTIDDLKKNEYYSDWVRHIAYIRELLVSQKEKVGPIDLSWCIECPHCNGGIELYSRYEGVDKKKPHVVYVDKIFDKLGKPKPASP